MAEFLNAEIVLNTIVNVELSLLQWIRTTFLRTCAVKRQIEDRNTDEIDAKLKGKFTLTATTTTMKNNNLFFHMIQYYWRYKSLNDDQFWHLILHISFRLSTRFLIELSQIRNDFIKLANKLNGRNSHCIILSVWHVPLIRLFRMYVIVWPEYWIPLHSQIYRIK